METIYSRVNQIIYNERITNRDLSEILNLAENSVSNKVNGKRHWTVEEIQSIATHFEKYSTDWLLLGKGSMFRKESTNNAIATGDNNIQVSGNGSSVGVNNELVDMLRHQLEMKDKQIEMLMGKIK